MKIGWDNLPEFKPMDIISVQTTEHWLSKSIRFFQRAPKESRSWASHSGMIYQDDLIIEALQRVVIRPLASYQDVSRVIIHRSSHEMTPQRLRLFFTLCGEYAGRKYGYLKILAHALDRAVGNRYVFRRLIFLKNYPICSWLVAHLYWKIFGEKFGVSVDEAQPDDILDYVSHNPGYTMIWCDSEETLDSFNKIYIQDDNPMA